MAYEMFISHCGPDTKGNVVEMIRDRLREREVFVDKSSLQPGQQNWETILAALRGARLVLIVLSPRYQESPWCMEELRIAVEEKWGDLRVICYGDGTSQVNQQALDAALEEYASSSTSGSSLLGRWKDALQKVSTVTGWWHDLASGSLPDLVDRVVKNLEGSLEAKPRDRDGDRIGIQERVDELLKNPEMQATGRVRLLGLTGMGGIGKTTLATALHDRLKSEFVSAVCFVADIRARTSQHQGIQEIQKQMLKNLADAPAKLPSDKVEGKNVLQDKLKGKRVLLILDNVGPRDWDLLPQNRDLLSLSALAPGSIVIITSREGDLLRTGGCKLEPVTLLTRQQSLLLFESGLGIIEVPAKTVDSVVSKCGDLPLTLVVLAGHLKAKKGKFWDEAITRLTLAEEFPNQHGKLFGRLRISYDDLNDRERNLFVDVACLLAAGMQPHRWMMAGTDEATFRGKYLLTTTEKGHISMHDQLRNLGLAIERDSAQRKRVWGDDAKHCFQGLTMTRARIALAPRLQVTPHFRILILHTRLLARMPASLGQLTSLRTLDLSRCSSLKALPDSLGQLTSLQTLGLSGCNTLEELPDSMSKLTSLQTLDLSCCSSLWVPLDSLSKLTSLHYLDLSCTYRVLGQLTSLLRWRMDLRWCTPLKALPESLGQLASLHTLDLSGCSTLKKLPNSLGQLTSLQTLDLSCCKALKTVPETLGQLTSLQTLDLSCCKALKALPETLGQLTSLQTLDLKWCSALKALPDSLGQLTSLQTLNLNWCSALKTLPETLDELIGLLILNLSWCEALKQLPESLGQLTSLRTLNLSWCEALKTLPDSPGQLTSLQTLDLSCCQALKALPLEFLAQLTSLQTLDLRDCKVLEALPDSLGQLTSLQKLDLRSCHALKELPASLGALERKGLRILR